MPDPNPDTATRRKLQYERCVNCNSPFSGGNTHSREGWLETQISGLCEDCFDEICAEDEEESGYDGPGDAPF